MTSSRGAGQWKCSGAYSGDLRQLAVGYGSPVGAYPLGPDYFPTDTNYSVLFTFNGTHVTGDIGFSGGNLSNWCEPFPSDPSNPLIGSFSLSMFVRI